MQAFRPSLRLLSSRGPATASPVVGPRRMPPSADRTQEVYTTATLTRGVSYTYRNVKFMRGQETAIIPELLKKFQVDTTINSDMFEIEVADLYEAVTDSDNEIWDKPIFEMRYNRPMPPTPAEEAAQRRPRRIRQYVDVPEARPLAGAGGVRPGLRR